MNQLEKCIKVVSNFCSTAVNYEATEFNRRRERPAYNDAFNSLIMPTTRRYRWQLASNMKQLEKRTDVVNNLNT